MDSVTNDTTDKLKVKKKKTPQVDIITHFEERIKKALKCLNEGNLTEAREHFAYAKRLIKTHYSLNKEHLAKILNNTQQNTSNDESNFPLLQYATLCNNIGKTYVYDHKKNKGDKKLAAEEFEIAGDCYAALERYDEAVEAYELALKQNRHSDACRIKLYQSQLKLMFDYPIKITRPVKKINAKNDGKGKSNTLIEEETVDVIPNADEVSTRLKTIFYFYPNLISIDFKKCNSQELITAAAITLQGVRFTVKNKDIKNEIIELEKFKPDPQKADLYCNRIANLLWYEKLKNKTTTKDLLNREDYRYVKKVVFNILQDKHKRFLEGCHKCMFQIKQKFYKQMINDLPEGKIRKIYQSKLDALDNQNCNNEKLYIHETHLKLLGIDTKSFQETDFKQSQYISFCQNIDNNDTDDAKIVSDSTGELESIMTSSKNAKDIIDLVNKFIDTEKLIQQLNKPSIQSNGNFDQLEDITCKIANTKSTFENECPWLKSHRNSFIRWFNELIDSLFKPKSQDTLSRNTSEDNVSDEIKSLSNSQSSVMETNVAAKIINFFRTTSEKTIDESFGISTDKFEKTYSENTPTM